MNLRKMNAVLSLIVTVLLMEHAIFYSVWMLTRGGIAKTGGPTPLLLVVLMVLHAVLSLLMAVLAHKGTEKHTHKTYVKLNVKTMIQRMSGLAMLLLLALHIIGANNHFQPKFFHAVAHPLFFAAVLAHTAVSGSKAFITLGVGNVSFVKILDKLLAVVCGVTFLAGVVGFYLCLFKGVVR